MAITAVAGTKGGLGKTTTSVNLAVRLALNGKRVLLVDGDSQHTALDAMRLRSHHNADELVALAHFTDGDQLYNQVLLQSRYYDEIIIDPGARDSSALRGALQVCDRLLSPLLPSNFDSWALEQTAALVDEANDFRSRDQKSAINALVFLNCAEPGLNREDNLAARRRVDDFPCLQLLDAQWVRRKAFAVAASAGLCVDELHRQMRDAKASNELRLLVEELDSLELPTELASVRTQ